MAFPNDKSAVSYIPATRPHLVSKKDFCREQNSQGWAPEFDDTHEMENDIPGSIPPAILPAKAKFKLIDKIKQTIHLVHSTHPAHKIYPAQTIIQRRRFWLPGRSC